MRLTFLSDNNGTDQLPGEWGLSIFIEYGEMRILLDAGASDLFFSNAEALGADLSRLDFAVLSHAHYDHGNGLVPLLERNPDVQVYLQRCCGADCYSRKSSGLEYIGLPEALSRFEDRLIRVEGDQSIAPGVWLIPHHGRNRAALGLREQMFRKVDGQLIPDDFSHEQSLVFETGRGLVILNSCSHAGASNIIDEVRAALPDRPVYAMIGGFHLFNKTEDQVRVFARQLRETGVAVICTGHCTGDVAFAILKQELGDRVRQFSTGLVLTL